MQERERERERRKVEERDEFLTQMKKNDSDSEYANLNKRHKREENK